MRATTVERAALLTFEHDASGAGRDPQRAPPVEITAIYRFGKHWNGVAGQPFDWTYKGRVLHA